jgi:hypothetical protein
MKCFDYYKNNPKLIAFVYKRYQYKMNKLEYTIEVEDISLFEQSLIKILEITKIKYKNFK